MTVSPHPTPFPSGPPALALVGLTGAPDDRLERAQHQGARLPCLPSPFQAQLPWQGEGIPSGSGKSARLQSRPWQHEGRLPQGDISDATSDAWTHTQVWAVGDVPGAQGHAAPWTKNPVRAGGVSCMRSQGWGTHLQPVTVDRRRHFRLK